MPIERWEYDLKNLMELIGAPLAARLNREGEDGWELVALLPLNNPRWPEGHWAVFKRPTAK